MDGVLRVTVGEERLVVVAVVGETPRSDFRDLDVDAGVWRVRSRFL